VVGVREAVGELIERLRPLLPDEADLPGWEALEVLADRGGAAGRIRDRVCTGADLPSIVSWLADETVLGLGLDRRTEQRSGG
jgi:hypothetical protein